MLAKILSTVRKKFNKISSSDTPISQENIIDDPIVEFVVQVDQNGNFAIGADCFSTQKEYAEFLGMTLYLLNAGMLSDYFVEALRLCSEGDEDKIKFVLDSITCWKQVYDHEIESSSKDAVEPKDVFSFYRMRPES